MNHTPSIVKRLTGQIDFLATTLGFSVLQSDPLRWRSVGQGQRRCLEIIVVLRSQCPRSSRTIRISWPFLKDGSRRNAETCDRRRLGDGRPVDGPYGGPLPDRPMRVVPPALRGDGIQGLPLHFVHDKPSSHSSHRKRVASAESRSFGRPADEGLAARCRLSAATCGFRARASDSGLGPRQRGGGAPRPQPPQGLPCSG